MLPGLQDLVRYIERHPGKRTRELAAHWKVPEEAFEDFTALLFRHQLEGCFIRVPELGWNIPDRTDYRVGELEVARGGQGFVRVAPGTIQEDDVFVRPEALAGAFPGDMVLLRVGKAPRGRNGGGKKLREGVVVDVVQRSRKPVRGEFKALKDGGLVKAADRRLGREVHIAPEEAGGARDGEKVLVRLLDGAPRGIYPRGKVILRLEKEGDYSSDLRTVRELHELPGEHPAAVLEEARSARDIEPGAKWPRREDLRDLLTFTIDPVDAKDFDDAVSLERLANGSLRLGIHIADVSHYVAPGSKLDVEAERRGTSVYLPGHVIPMLPERLSNDLCSLRPEEDRLTKTVRLTFSPKLKLKRTEIFRSVIRSRKRFTYEEVLAILQGTGSRKPGSRLPPDQAEFAEILRQMAALRDELAEARTARGALNLDIPKLRLELDEGMQVRALGRDERDASHSLIEELMLAANEAVAAYFIEHKLPLIARVHPPPDEEKLEDLRSFVEALGHRLKGHGDSKDLQKLIAAVKDDPLAPVVNLGILRTMGHAEYAFGADLHFALATSSYCHFTSPIRRYPDLLVHQALDEHFDGRLHKATLRREWDHRLPHAAELASKLERRAEEAERDMTRLQLIRYLQGLVGQQMDGRIVSIHPFGFFVRADETLIEGLVHVATLNDDFYEFDRKRLRLSGKRTRRRFQIGERVRVELVEVDADAREISFRFLRRLKEPA